jgi:hypothetical protein
MAALDWLAVIFAYAIVAFLVALGLMVLWKIARADINLGTLLSETGDNNKASLSRFQFMVFTFIVAGVYLLLCIQSREFVDVPNGVLGLIGISGGSYVGAKITQKAAQARTGAAPRTRQPQQPGEPPQPPPGALPSG